jgi:DnaJ-class molecular chaperone
MTHITCPRCGCAARVTSHDSAHCVQCFTTFRTCCASCGQMGATIGPCDTCRALERAPQGESLALFTPAPAMMAGQTHMEV